MILIFFGGRGEFGGGWREREGAGGGGGGGGWVQQLLMASVAAREPADFLNHKYSPVGKGEVL